MVGLGMTAQLAIPSAKDLYSGRVLYAHARRLISYTRTRSTVLIHIRIFRRRKTPDYVVRQQWVGAGRLPSSRRVTNLQVGYPKIIWGKKIFSIRSSVHHGRRYFVVTTEPAGCLYTLTMSVEYY